MKTFDRIWRFIGSIQLAVPLLGAIVLVLVGATFYESKVGSVSVQHEIYQSPWFGALMFLLAVNLGVSALNRYPWRNARQVGFALTHLGLIVIIAGSAAVIHLGVEGMLLVRTDRGANNQVRMQGDLLEVMNPDRTVESGNIFINRSGKVYPTYLAGLELADYRENTVRSIQFIEGETVPNPAVRLSLTSDRMGQNIERSLAVAPSSYSQMTLGIAELAIVQTNSDEELQQLLSPPSNKTQHLWGELKIDRGQKQAIVDVKDNISKSVNFNDLTIELVDFFPDFRLDKNRLPTTASSQFNNPAILLEISSSTGTEGWFVFGKAEFPPIRTVISGERIADLQLDYQFETPPAEDYFHVIATEDDKLYYTAKSSNGFKSGTLAIGESVTPGWADFQITLKEYIPHGKLQRTIVPADNPQVQGNPALLVKTAAGTATWLPWGEPTTIEEPEGEIYAAFGPKLLALPFGIKLEDFIVDRNEGSQSVAMWTSKIRIQDPINRISKQRNVWMNHPTWYRGWKIAQASWNPGDLQQSTLQVKREPTWVTALTWTGSALVVSGIAVMFYAPALMRKMRSKSNQTEPATAVTPEVAEKPEDEGIDRNLTPIS
ncbi:cytochrome c biogenesis protein ResB [Oscillatoriales cyanobacterium LEGE 11467]|uniref:Cytochrome c biogenesis protein ResB n=1 Tax=Zarconia navalis LEGE 11467 TaxID=1828826 RepID=A0A928Z9C2_9CYAN|nr:cytochrome c biogenesis protein ResB [Zarconia navalis]MBE9041544.1 cytochrome c biogenesis protein ResB [Zarconia navalis LEGE 11467]